MELGESREPTATEIIMDTQTEIKELVKMALLNVNSMITFRESLEKLLDKNLQEIKNEELRRTAKKSLEQFAFNQLQQMNNILDLKNLPLIVVFASQIQNNTKKAFQVEINNLWQNIGRTTVNKAFSQLGNSQAMVKNNQSLYGHSELVTRYEEQQDALNRLRTKTRLVICDTHSDCSDRCFPWQGRVYSLDGTSGITDDGREYVPLEEATNVIDKYGYKNGLLGFNCRHKLMPYQRGKKPVNVTKREQTVQNEITTKQRAMEIKIRANKEKALSFKGIDNDKYKLYRNNVTNLLNEYKEFCKMHNRVEYRSRINI